MIDDDGFVRQRYRRNQGGSRNASFSGNGINFELGRPNDARAPIDDEYNSETDDDDENIENIILESPFAWHQFALIGNVKQRTIDLLNEYGISAISELDKLNNLISHIPNVPLNNVVNSENCLITLSTQCGRMLKFISIIPNFTPRDYGIGIELFFVHVRYDTYILAEKNPAKSEDINVPPFYGFLGNKPTHVPISAPSADVEDNRTNFMRIMKIVEGKMEHDKFQQIRNGDDCDEGKRKYYDYRIADNVSTNNRSIKKCKLHLEDSFSGYGKIMDAFNLDKKIYLHNRRNCFQAFNQDIVNIEIFKNERKKSFDIWSGRVISVEQSEVKPINKIFLCKLSFGHANFMIPICNTIPTIEVDNSDAKELVKRNFDNLIDGLKDVIGIENLIQSRIMPDHCKSFADKYFVSLKCLGSDLKTTFDKIRYVDSFRCDFIFLVIYRRWNSDKRFPTGEVVGLYTPDASFTKTFPLIAVSCDLSVVSIAEEQELEQEIQKIYVETDNCRPIDFKITNKYVFGFKYKHQSFIEIAYSHEDINEESFRVGIHVAHVGKYIKHDDFFDKVAMKQFFTFLMPPNHRASVDETALYLFPGRLTNDVFSINRTRPTDVISVYFSVFRNDSTCLTDKSLVFEHIVLNETIDVETFDKERVKQPCLEDIYTVCFKRRMKRTDSHHIPHNWLYPDYSLKMNMSSFIVSEELDIIANKFFKKHLNLTTKVDFPVHIIDRIVHHNQFDIWMDTVQENCYIQLFPTLKKHFSRRRTEKRSIRFSQQLLERVIKNTKINLLKCDMLFPDVSFYAFLLDKIIVRKAIGAKSEAGDSAYLVSVTKPLSCISDVFLQRLIVLNQPNNDDYTNNICTRYKDNDTIFNRYWTICRGYDFKERFHDASFILDCVFEDVTDESIVFQHPFLQDIYHCNFILFECLKLSQAKLPFNNDIENPELEWETKIFVYDDVDRQRYYEMPFQLKDIYSYKDIMTWREKLVRSNLVNEDRVKMKDLLSESKYPTDMTSETSRNMDPNLTLKLTLEKRQILRIQFTYDYSIGIMKITPELVILNPHLRICLCHRVDPFKYFIHPGNLARINYQRFTHLTDYKEQFRILSRIEGIYQTIRESTSYFIHNIPIYWLGTKNVHLPGFDQADDIHGVVILEYDWCTARFIRLGHKNLRIQDPVNTLKKAIEYSQMEYIACIQSFIVDKNAYWMGHAQILDVAYIGHRHKKRVQVTLKLTHSNFPFKAQHEQKYSLEIMETPITARILDRSLRRIKANSLVERIVMNQVSNEKYQDSVLVDYDTEIKTMMKSPYQFNQAQLRAVNIAMNFEFSLIWGPPGTGKTMVGCIIAFAFTLINRRSSNDAKASVLYCGPSNKSVDVVAEKLMKTFGDNCPKLLRIYSSDFVNSDFPYPCAIKNRESSPTSEYLKPIALHHIIREEGKPYAARFRSYNEYFLKNIFRDNVDRLAYAVMVKKYQNDLKKAYVEEAKVGNYEIVLCTAVGSCRKFLEEFNFTQVIVDEAGMCTEPENIGPILNRINLKNTIFMGDHKQLRPIVTSESAKGKRFDQSLLERIYNPDRLYCTMLDTQYRMHPSICEFPSQYFYKRDNSTLKTALSESWSGIPVNWIENNPGLNGLNSMIDDGNYKRQMARNNVNIADELWRGKRSMHFECYPVDCIFPIIEKILFINVDGYECNQAVSGITGHVKSKGNEEEVKAVVRLYRYLINKIKNKDKASQSILIITQYRLQEHLLREECTKILSELKVKGPPQISTVVRSQGSECDYVIFSTVRSLPHKNDIDINPSPGWISKYLGFIADKNQFNVAITRAQKGLFIFGNKALLSVNQNWKAMIENLESRKCVAVNIFDVV